MFKNTSKVDGENVRHLGVLIDSSTVKGEVMRQGPQLKFTQGGWNTAIVSFRHILKLVLTFSGRAHSKKSSHTLLGPRVRFLARVQQQGWVGYMVELFFVGVRGGGRGMELHNEGGPLAV